MEPLSAGDPRVIGGFRLHARLGSGRNDDWLCDIRRKHREELPGDFG
jgi:hypothetical protein